MGQPHHFKGSLCITDGGRNVVQLAGLLDGVIPDLLVEDPQQLRPGDQEGVRQEDAVDQNGQGIGDGKPQHQGRYGTEVDGGAKELRQGGHRHDEVNETDVPPDPQGDGHLPVIKWWLDRPEGVVPDDDVVVDEEDVDCQPQANQCPTSPERR